MCRGRNHQNGRQLWDRFGVDNNLNRANVYIDSAVPEAVPIQSNVVVLKFNAITKLMTRKLQTFRENKNSGKLDSTFTRITRITVLRKSPNSVWRQIRKSFHRVKSTH